MEGNLMNPAMFLPALVMLGALVNGWMALAEEKMEQKSSLFSQYRWQVAGGALLIVGGQVAAGLAGIESIMTICMLLCLLLFLLIYLLRSVVRTPKNDRD